MVGVIPLSRETCEKAAVDTHGGFVEDEGDPTGGKGIFSVAGVFS